MTTMSIVEIAEFLIVQAEQAERFQRDKAEQKFIADTNQKLIAFQDSLTRLYAQISVLQDNVGFTLTEELINQLELAANMLGDSHRPFQTSRRQAVLIGE